MARALAALVLLFAGPVTSVLANTARPPDEVLMGELRSWVSGQKTASPVGEALPLDRRVQVPRCEPGWTFDFPFSTAEVVRARCSTASAQLYVRMRQGAPAAPVPASLSPSDRAGASREPPSVGGPRVEEPSRARTVLVARTALARGARLTPESVQLVDSSDGRPAPGFLGDPSAVIDMEVTRDLRPGEALRPGDVRPATLVRRGEVVTLELARMQGFSIRARVEALHDGRRGETVKLINRESGKTVSGVVVGVNQVEVR
jgi:flagella basal body P-ring formation protein FlgA